jgi:hypothetical protein
VQTQQASIKEQSCLFAFRVEDYLLSRNAYDSKNRLPWSLNSNETKNLDNLPYPDPLLQCSRGEGPSSPKTALLPGLVADFFKVLN